MTHARTGAVPTAVASVTVLAPDLTRVDIDATAAFAQDGDALTWLRTRTGRRDLVVWSDGRGTSSTTAWRGRGSGVRKARVAGA